MYIRALHDGPNSPQVWIPATARDVVGVADRVAVLRFFAANLTCECHWCVAPYINLVYDRTFMVAEYPGSEKQFGGKSPRIRIGLALPQMPSGQCAVKIVQAGT